GWLTRTDLRQPGLPAHARVPCERTGRARSFPFTFSRGLIRFPDSDMFMDVLDTARAALEAHPLALTALQLTGLIIVVWLVDRLTAFLLLRAIGRVVRAT